MSPARLSLDALARDDQRVVDAFQPWILLVGIPPPWLS
jgi:hypothetical protein